MPQYEELPKYELEYVMISESELSVLGGGVHAPCVSGQPFELPPFLEAIENNSRVFGFQGLVSAYFPRFPFASKHRNVDFSRMLAQ